MANTAASSERYGAYLARHGSLNLVAPILTFCFGLLAALLGGFMLNAAFKNIQWIGSLAAIVGGLALLVSGGAAICVASLSIGIREQMLFYERGFVVQQVWRAFAVEWSDVSALREEYVVLRRARYASREVYRMRLELMSGRFVRLTVQAHKEGKVRDIIQRQVTQALEPKALAALRKGESLQFGALELSEKGVTKAAQTLTWDNMESVSLRKGVLMIKQKNKRLEWVTLRDANVPNVSLFLAIVEAMRSESQETQTNQASL